MNDDIMVSVICLTYNHRPYIRQALESLLNQKTDFRYEIIVHDDASNDGTTNIIKEIVDNNPDMFIPIYQTDNQYSKGCPAKEFTYPCIRGKYVAYCEGDDYWTDVNKLQRQVDFLENNSDYSACGHQCEVINMKNHKKHFWNDAQVDYDLDIVASIINDTSNVYQTASLVHRASILPCIKIENPKIFNIYGNSVGDYPLRLFLMKNGKIRFLAKSMSVYRSMVPGSWTERNTKMKTNKIKMLKNQLKMIRVADEYFGFKYHEEIKKRIIPIYYSVSLLEKRKRRCVFFLKKLYNISSVRNKIAIIVKIILVFLYFAFINIRDKI